MTIKTIKSKNEENHKKIKVRIKLKRQLKNKDAVLSITDISKDIE